VVVDLDPDGAWGSAADIQALPPAAGFVLLGPAAGDTRLVDEAGDRPWAYLLKEAGTAELARAIEAVGSGLVVVQPPLDRRLFTPANLSPDPFPAGEGETRAEVEALTAREHEVLQLVAEGLPNKLIALKLGISEHTVKFHVTSILSKLDASSRTEAVRLGARRGLVVL
jgi:two-component system, NarL family, response regulator YdfI